MTERERCCTCNDSKSDILFISLFSVRSRSSSQTHSARKVNLASLANLLPAALASRRASAAGRLQVLSQNSTEEHTEKPANPEPPQFSGDTAQFLSQSLKPWTPLGSPVSKPQTTSPTRAPGLCDAAQLQEPGHNTEANSTLKAAEGCQRKKNKYICKYTHTPH